MSQYVLGGSSIDKLLDTTLFSGITSLKDLV